MTLQAREVVKLPFHVDQTLSAALLLYIYNKIEGKEKRPDSPGSGLGVNYTILAVADTGWLGSTCIYVVDIRLP